MELLDLKGILEMGDAAERRRLLIIRGWQLQELESKSDEQRAFCEWMISLASTPSLWWRTRGRITQLSGEGMMTTRRYSRQVRRG